MKFKKSNYGLYTMSSYFTMDFVQFSIVNLKSFIKDDFLYFLLKILETHIIATCLLLFFNNFFYTVFRVNGQVYSLDRKWI